MWNKDDLAPITVSTWIFFLLVYLLFCLPLTDIYWMKYSSWYNDTWRNCFTESLLWMWHVLFPGFIETIIMVMSHPYLTVCLAGPDSLVFHCVGFCGILQFLITTLLPHSFLPSKMKKLWWHWNGWKTCNATAETWQLVDSVNEDPSVDINSS